MRVIWIFWPTALLLVSCSKPGETMCQQSIKSVLLNPETAKFYDYNVIPPEEKLAAESARVTTGERSRESLKEIIYSGDRKYSAVRVRAEGQLGNTVTKTMSCEFDKKSCNCMDDVSDG